MGEKCCPLVGTRIPSARPWARDLESGDNADQRVHRSVPAGTPLLVSGQKKHERPSYGSQKNSSKDGTFLSSLPSHCSEY